MKSIIAAAAFAAVLSATTAAYAGHPLLPNGWPIPESQTPYLTPEQIEHREFMNVQRGTFPGTRATQISRSRANASTARRAAPQSAYPSYYGDDAYNRDDTRHRP